MGEVGRGGGGGRVLNLPKKWTFLAKCDFWWPICASGGGSWVPRDGNV